MRILSLDGEHHSALFASLFTVFATSRRMPQSADELVTASQIKSKLVAISSSPDGAKRLDRTLDAGEHNLHLKESEWAYLRDAVTPPMGLWSNFGADEALAVLELLKEIPLVPDGEPEPEARKRKK